MSPNPLCFNNHVKNFKGACRALVQMSAVEVQRLRGVPLASKCRRKWCGLGTFLHLRQVGVKFPVLHGAPVGSGELPGAQVYCALLSPNLPHGQLVGGV